MKQSINLYQAILFPVRHTYTLKRLLISSAFIFAVFIMIWAVLFYQLSAVENKVAKQEQDLQDKMDVVTLYQQALQQRKPTASLVEQFDRAKTELVQLQKLQTFLNNRQQQSDQLYSPVLQHLDRIHDRGLWLTAFQLNQSNSSFQGVALEPVSVTRWLTKLRQFNYFQGQDFSHVSVSQIPEDTAVNFVLSADKGAK